MKNIKQRLADVEWESVAKSMHAKGYAQVPGLLSANECDSLIANYDEPKFYRKTITMERFRFGLGEYKYFNYPLPEKRCFQGSRPWRISGWSGWE
jgi:uncharacterized protein